jgi:hypothetical protein
MMTKLVIERGTATATLPKVYSIWSGQSFLEYQKKKMSSLPAKLAFSSKRGTSSIKLSDYTIVDRLPTKGFVISTARGTATRIL